MTAKTISARVTTAVEPSYADMLTRARQLVVRDVETRFELAVIFSKMIKFRTAEQIADDTEMSPGGVKKMIEVAEFWGNVRIKSEGRRHPSWYLYDRVVHESLIDDERRVLIKRAAPNGIGVVHQMLRESRQVSIARVNEVVNGKRANRTTAPRVAKSRGSGRNRAVPSGSSSLTTEEIDAVTIVADALDHLGEAIVLLDRLESLSEDDSSRVRAKVNDVVAHVVRLTEVR